MNLTQTREVEAAITKYRVDGYDAINLFDAVYSGLLVTYEDLPQDYIDLYNRLIVATEKLERGTGELDEMDMAKDFLIAQDEKHPIVEGDLATQRAIKETA